MRFSTLAAVFVAFTLSLVTVESSADGVLLETSRMKPSVRTQLGARIAEAKLSHPEAFRAIRRLQGHRPEVYRRFRSQRPNVVPELEALGPGGLWALIDAIAFGGLDRGGATPEQWDAVREGLLTALAELETPQASPLFRQILVLEGSDWTAKRGAALGLGRLGGPDERKALLEAIERGGVDRDAALWGLRYVRRHEVVEAVAPLLADRSDQTVRLAARALGYIGSSWAWRTGNAGDPAQQMPIRNRCADVLLEAYLHHVGRTRQRIAQAFAMVDHPNASSMVQARLHTVVDAEDRAALLELGQRMAR